MKKPEKPPRHVPARDSELLRDEQPIFNPEVAKFLRQSHDVPARDSEVLLTGDPPPSEPPFFGPGLAELLNPQRPDANDAMNKIVSLHVVPGFVSQWDAAEALWRSENPDSTQRFADLAPGYRAQLWKRVHG